MKILILANFGMGLYKFRKELIKELIKKNNQVYISCPNDDEFVPLLKKMGCEFLESEVDRRGVNPIKDLKLMAQYGKYTRNIKPDVVLTYTIKPNIYGGIVCRFMKVPYISNITGLGSAVENGGVLQKITIGLNKIALKKARCVFFQNDENKQFFVDKKVVAGTYKLLPGSGINLEEYPLLDYPGTENGTHFLFISRILKEKGIDQYLDAAKYITKKHSDTHFHILGFCEDERYLRKIKEMEKEGIVKFHGMQSDVKKYHKISHCTIHPSYYPEGMSNVLLESAASGRPSITTNRSGCKEIIDNRVTGYLVKPQDSKDLIDKIELFLEKDYKDREKMGKLAREKVAKEFNRNLVVESYLKVMRI